MTAGMFGCKTFEESLYFAADRVHVTRIPLLMGYLLELAAILPGVASVSVRFQTQTTVPVTALAGGFW
jgi:hypothetical protein